MSDLFFDPAINRGHAAAVLGLRKTRPAAAVPLQPGVDDEWLRLLQLACVDHRRMLFELGARHRISLHYGACLSMTEIVLTLYLYWLRIDPSSPHAQGRDRFILSKGHAAPSLYLTLFQAGFVAEGQFANYRSLDSVFQGHPDRNKLPGVDCTTGSLGQGLPVACGMAWALRQSQPAARVYCLISDGECNEGSIWEAAMIGANAKLDNLVAIVDRNRKSSFGTMAGRNDIEPLADKWRAFGWHVLTVDGHDIPAITQALAGAASHRGRPTLILADTIKGRGIPYAEKNFVRSSSSLPVDQLAEAMAGQNAREEALTR
jgi:transketolase